MSASKFFKISQFISKLMLFKKWSRVYFLSFTRGHAECDCTLVTVCELMLYVSKVSALNNNFHCLH